jgi:sec-independent protein translocase protein TatA
MPNLGTTELIIVAVIILVLFGAKRLPDSARALGRSMRILKAETKGLRDDSDTTSSDTRVTDTTVQAHPLPPVQPQAPGQSTGAHPSAPSAEQPQQRSA